MLRLKHIEGGTGGGMMGRLIDAGKFLNNLSGMLKSMEDYDAVRKVINNMPTAYDVDKVIEEIEGASWLTTNDDGETNKLSIQVVSFDDAIEIVKAGGKNE